MATIEKKNIIMTMKKMLECDICGEDYSNFNKVKCPFCDFFCCATCFNRHLLTTTGDTKCMSCKQNYDMDTVWKLSSTKIYKDYINFKHEQLIQKELSLSQETLIEIEQERLQKKANDIFQLSIKYRKAIQLVNSLQLLVLDMSKVDKNITENMVSQLGFNFENIKTLNATRATEMVNTEIQEAIKNSREN